MISNAPEVLLSATDAPFYPQYLRLLRDGIASASSMLVAKTCLACFRKLCEKCLDPAIQVPEEVEFDRIVECSAGRCCGRCC